MSKHKFLSTSLSFLALAAVAGGAFAVPLQAVSTATPPKGGGVDGPFFPRVAVATPASETTGADLQRQAQMRLSTSLAANGALANGATLTKAQAQASGLDYVAKNFSQIDTAGSGKVSLKDVQQYLNRQ
ncbi:hypothetical protein [Paraburkholderia megapolitana]|uniref:EF-hand domain-containing protein n=1 Tax=Paraburkholderia megapolitana TaxID=420953 RepID=A0A1I3DAU8_9BURK|nr:hypothetical protein [Paraburkholderia megapolitana]QDQ81749.1 hypothetical protein FNZ07_11625 [Paraburkholderia megapolitana]SFH83678.1 hypothetical protein SAMN05192543_101197 [Paraburkholderia megapolitana]